MYTFERRKNMDIEREKLVILEKLQAVNSQITKETIQKASEKEILEYLDLIEKIELELQLG